MAMTSGEEKLKKLEYLYMKGVSEAGDTTLSIETFMDVFLVLYDECSSSTLRREKNISEFVEFGMFIIFNVLLTIYVSFYFDGSVWQLISISIMVHY